MALRLHKWWILLTHTTLSLPAMLRNASSNQHAKAFVCISRSLSPPIVEKTLGHRTNVPELLQMLKNCWSDNTTQDLDRMRTQFDSMRLSDVPATGAFITTFNNQVRVMRNHDMGLVARDEDVLFAFNKALPSAWNLQKEVSSAAFHSLKQAQNYYLKAAATDESYYNCPETGFGALSEL